MDTKVTLHFDSSTIQAAKAFAASNNISLSRLTEFLYRKMTTGNYKTLEDLPISDWVAQVAEGEAEYKRRSRSDTKKEYFSNKK